MESKEGTDFENEKKGNCNLRLPCTSRRDEDDVENIEGSGLKSPRMMKTRLDLDSNEEEPACKVTRGDDLIVNSENAELSEKDTETPASNDCIQLSDSVYIFPNRNISNYGNVFAGEIRSGLFGVRVCAIKFSRKSQQNVKEASFLTKLASHTHIVSIIQSGICEDTFGERVYIALDKCHDQNLGQYLIHQNEYGVKFDPIEAFKYSRQILDGVMYVHENLIIHLDLKPPNVLLSNDKSTIKLADFGSSQEISSTFSKRYCKHQFGTNGFRPPESFGNNWASLKSDVYSLGALLYFVLSNGKSPFGDEITLWLSNTKNGVIDLRDLLVTNRKSFQHLIEQMLSKERCRRPSIWQVAEHSCWTGNDVECNFDYGFKEEVDERAETNLEIQEQDSQDSLTEAESCRQFIMAMESMGYSKSPSHRRPTSGDPESAIIIFDKESKYLHCWSPETRSIKRMHEFNDVMKTCGFSSVCIDHQIYVLTKQVLYRLEYADLTATWERINVLDGCHGSIPIATVVFGAIYVVGSEDERWKRSVSKYDPQLNQWKRLADKKLSTTRPAIVALKEFVYCAGGYLEGYDTTEKVEKLNVTSGIWDDVAPMCEARWHSSAVECNGKIIIGGGMDHRMRDLDSVENYDPDTNQWTLMNPMTKKRSWFRLHSVEGCVYAFGGDLDDKTIEKYNIQKKEWEILPTPGSGMWIYESIFVGAHDQLV